MVHKLAKRLHDALCADKYHLCNRKHYYIELAQIILGDEYVFITTEEFTNLREVYITV